MTRRQILKKIDILLTNHCGNCERQKEYKSKIMRGNDTKLSKYCNKVCPVGKNLQACGRELAEVTA